MTRKCVCHLGFAVQGEYCVQIKMDVLPGSGIVAVGAQQVRVPATPQSIVRQVSKLAGLLLPIAVLPMDWMPMDWKVHTLTHFQQLDV